jgi:hypothetical protein
MSTIKVTNVSHPSAASPAIVLDADGDATYAGVHDFSAATVTGAGGLRLVTPTSIANSGGSASASGGAVTFTGVTSVSLNAVFSSTYENYLIVITVLGSIPDNISIRFRTAGTDNTSSTYAHQRLIVDGASVTAGRATAQTKSIWGNVGTASAAVNQILIGTPFDATKITSGRSACSSSYLSAFIQESAFVFSSNVSFDGFTILPDSGNMTGVVRCYGYQNS